MCVACAFLAPLPMCGSVMIARSILDLHPYSAHTVQEYVCIMQDMSEDDRTHYAPFSMIGTVREIKPFAKGVWVTVSTEDAAVRVTMWNTQPDLFYSMIENPVLLTSTLLLACRCCYCDSIDCLFQISSTMISVESMRNRPVLRSTPR